MIRLEFSATSPEDGAGELVLNGRTGSREQTWLFWLDHSAHFWLQAWACWPHLDRHEGVGVTWWRDG